MRRFVLSGLAVVALLIAVVLSPGVRAQDRSTALDRRFRMFGPATEIGISVRDLRKEEAAKIGQSGVTIEDVRADSPAAHAGMRSGDVIVEFDGERVRSVQQLVRLIAETPADRTVKAAVVRDGSKRTLDVSPEASNRVAFDGALPDIWPQIERGLRTLPRDLRLDREERRRAPGGGAGRLGVSLTALTEQLSTFFGVKSGVLISSVEASSPAARAGLKAGDVILAINGRDVKDPLSVREQVRSAGGTLEMRILRDKREITVKVALTDRAVERDGSQPV